MFHQWLTENTQLVFLLSLLIQLQSGGSGCSATMITWIHDILSNSHQSSQNLIFIKCTVNLLFLWHAKQIAQD